MNIENIVVTKIEKKETETEKDSKTTHVLQAINADTGIKMTLTSDEEFEFKVKDILQVKMTSRQSTL